MQPLLAILLLLVLNDCFAAPPSEKKGTITPKYIPGQYIIGFSNGSDISLSSFADIKPNNVVLKESNIIVLNLNPEDVLKLKNKKGVIIEQDQYVSMSGSQLNPLNWGLDRTNQRKLPLDKQFTFTDTLGSGVNVYIIDTGILTTHKEFGTRAKMVKNFVGDGKNYDCQGHGTHVASTIGGNTVGFARKANLLALKVLNCAGSGTTSNIISALKYVTTAHKTSTIKKTIVNLSLGGGYSPLLNAEVKATTNAGIVVVVAAGNEFSNACNASPASAPSAITVAATDKSDYETWWSNWGSCVDIYGPGDSIYGASISGNSLYTTKSGTSMAAPHVAGVAALYWGTGTYTVSSLTNKLISISTKDAVKLNWSVNRLLFQST